MITPNPPDLLPDSESGLGKSLTNEPDAFQPKRSFDTVAGIVSVQFWRLRALFDRVLWSFQAEMDQRRGFLWLPVLLGLGILIYFSLPREPVAPVLWGLTILSGTLASRAWLRGRMHHVLVVLTIVLAGTSAAKLRVDRVAAPLLTEAASASIEGRLIKIDVRGDRPPRLVLDRLVIDGLADDERPQRVRVTIRTKGDLPEIGSRIAFQARLLPVPGAAKPGGYDPRRAAFFAGIGASGFVFTHPQVIEPNSQFSLRLMTERLRAAIAIRIMETGPSDAKAVAVALLVGERGYLSEEVVGNLRAAGLAHVLAISGLHMALITGTAFFLIRALLSLSPTLALRYPIHKWAAAAAILTGACYLSISGGSISTIRAFIMAAVMFGAVIAGRPALSLRNLAIAALTVLAIWPESIAQPGFQMSFASVMALISVWEVWRTRQRIKLHDPSKNIFLRSTAQLRRTFFAIGLTTLIASLATAPFAAYHFNQFVSYSLIGNILAMPFVSLFVMPAGLLVLILMPLALEALPLAVMTGAIDIILAISDWVAGLPGSEVSNLIVPKLSLTLIAAGMIWLCLWGRRWRFLGVLPILLGIILAPILVSRPDILISADGRLVGVWNSDHQPTLSGRLQSSFVLDQWLGRHASENLDRQALTSQLNCDGSACLADLTTDKVLSHVKHAQAFAEDCIRAEIVVTGLIAPNDCVAPIIIDAERLAESGSVALWLDAGSSQTAIHITKIETAWPTIRRPWHGVAQGSN